jgi:hypothetical protein
MSPALLFPVKNLSQSLANSKMFINLRIELIQHGNFCA